MRHGIPPRSRFGQKSQPVQAKKIEERPLAPHVAHAVGLIQPKAVTERSVAPHVAHAIGLIQPKVTTTHSVAPHVAAAIQQPAFSSHGRRPEATISDNRVRPGAPILPTVLMPSATVAQQRVAPGAPLRIKSPQSVIQRAAAAHQHYTAKKIDKFSDTFDMDEDEDEDKGLEKQIPQRTSDEEVQKAVEEKLNKDVVLWRGTIGPKAQAIVANQSAGGSPSNPSAAPPTIELAQQQVKSGGVLTEYSADKGPVGFSFGHWLVAVQINTRYLTRGSSSENGWVCASSAPVRVLATVDRTYGNEDLESINAS